MPGMDAKLVVLGNEGVGKSALTIRFVQGLWVDKYDPTIEDSYLKSMELDSNAIFVEILDTAGSEQFNAMRTLYMKAADGFVIVYSITQAESFITVEELLLTIFRTKDTKDFPAVVIGNKLDLDMYRVCSQEDTKQLLKDYRNCTFFEASAKTNVNVDEAFASVIRAVYKTPKLANPMHSRPRTRSRELSFSNKPGVPKSKRVSACQIL